MKLIFGNALWHLLLQSDTVTKCIMLGLLILSIVCWTIIFYKLMQFSEKSKQLRELFKKLEKIRTAGDVQRTISNLENFFGGALVVHYMNEYQEFLSRKKILTSDDKEELDELRYSLVDELVFQQWIYMPILFVASAASPLIGLFGTVWGLTHAFMNIGQKQTADIVTVAPGIAEALLTTLAGLIVAIPALVAYHYLSSYVRSIEHQLFQMSDALVRVSRSYLFPKE